MKFLAVKLVTLSDSNASFIGTVKSFYFSILFLCLMSQHSWPEAVSGQQPLLRLCMTRGIPNQS